MTDEGRTIAATIAAAEAPSPRLTAVGVRVERGRRTVLRVPYLALAADEIVVLLGPNGAGKSTLLQALGLLIPLANGSVHLDGQPIVDRRASLAARRRMAMAFQEPLLFDTTVAGNVAAGLRIHGYPKATIDARVDDWQAALGITHLARRQASALSGGEAQRVSLARALALDPDILLLDEPFAALDAATRSALLDDVARLVRRPGRAVVIVTHDRTEAARLADRIGVILDGQVAQIGPPAEVFGRPVSPAVAAVVGMDTILAGRVIATDAGGTRVSLGPHTVLASASIPVGQAVHVCLRPEDVALVPYGSSPGGATDRSPLPGIVRRVAPQGPLARIEIDAGVSLVAYVTQSTVDDLHLAPGVPIVASLKATAVHLIPAVALPAAEHAPHPPPLAAMPPRGHT